MAIKEIKPAPKNLLTDESLKWGRHFPSENPTLPAKTPRRPSLIPNTPSRKERFEKQNIALKIIRNARPTGGSVVTFIGVNAELEAHTARTTLRFPLSEFGASGHQTRTRSRLDGDSTVIDLILKFKR